MAFLSRVPLPERSPPASVPAGPTFLRFAPIAGAVVACPGAVALLLADLVRLPSLAGAILALAATVVTTGALHEDGLSDVADGFGGGRTREAKLAIMRDSRIGTFGAAALGLALLQRCACLAAVIDRGGWGRAVAALFLAAILSRAAMLLPLAALPPARTDGLARAVGRLPAAAVAVATLLALGLGVIICLAAAWPWQRLALSAILAAAGALALVRLARRQIGGVTGDVVGATQQVAEVAVLLTLASGLGAV